MDRTIVYPGAIPLDTDILSLQVNAMTAVGYLAEATMGLLPFVSGLLAVPTSPASMTIRMTPGSLGVGATVDGSGFGRLPANTDSMVKIGFNSQSTLLPFTAPTVAGQSQAFVIQVSLDEHDDTSIVIP